MVLHCSVVCLAGLWVVVVFFKASMLAHIYACLRIVLHAFAACLRGWVWCVRSIASIRQYYWKL